MITLYINDELTVTSNEGANREIMSEFWVGAYRRNAMKLDFGSVGSLTFEHKEDDLWCIHVYYTYIGLEKTEVKSEEELSSLISSMEEDFDAAENDMLRKAAS